MSTRAAAGCADLAVAYSGGRDSTALLHATLRAAHPLGLRVHGLHVHHGLSRHADDWLAHCERTCRNWARRGWPVQLHHVKLELAPRPGQSVEALARDARYAEIDAELAEVVAARTKVAAEVSADLLALYDRLRAAKNGVGAAALRARQCGGCMLTLDNAELAVIRAAADDEVLRCEECQRILVRSFESGL